MPELAVLETVVPETVVPGLEEPARAGLELAARGPGAGWAAESAQARGLPARS